MKRQLPISIHCASVGSFSQSKSTRLRRNALFLGIAASVAVAQPTFGQPAAGSQELEEIIVTATRREQSVQDVAVSITALSGEQLEKLKFFEFEDMAAATPGLSMTSTAREPGVIAVRGIGFAPNSSAPPAVDVYLNELPIDAVYAFTSIYDIQQMELLRGPQGTLRGRPSPAGAVTMTTRRPDLGEVGGSVSGSFSDADAQNYQGALNVPIVKDTLALRVAGVKNTNEGPGGKLLNGDAPEVDDEGLRATLLFQATDELEFLLTHHYMDRAIDNFTFVEGAGAGYNGPAISADDRRGVAEKMGRQDQEIEITSLQASWDIGEHQLVYIGGYQDLTNEFMQDLDGANAVVDYSSLQHTATDFEVTTHELRFESGGGGRIDYSAGLWYSDTETSTDVHQVSELTGAFGYPPTPRGPADPAYLIGVDIYIPTDAENTAAFGHLEFHVTDKLDIGVGARYLEEKSERSQQLDLGSSLIAIDIGQGEPLTSILCPTILGQVTGLPWQGQTYPNTCDLALAASSFYQPAEEDWDHWVYDASIRYSLSDLTMVYFTAAHSWRPPGVTVGITAPIPDDILFGPPEQSDAFELGLKSEWLDRRLRFNAAMFYQEFDGFIGRFEDVPYVNDNTQTVDEGGFTYNGDAIAYGLEADLFWLISDEWTAQLSMSAQKGEFDDASVPCRDTDFDGKPDNGANPAYADWGASGPVAFCVSDDPISNLPEWNATLQSEYVIPRDALEYYLRGLLNYQPENDNFTTGFERDSFALMNLYAGVRSSDGRWDVTLWAKNALDEDTVLQLDSEGVVAGFASGYRGVAVLPEREIGVSVRYAFGSD
ncbi:MAG: TonB-dependent receptor [Pseudomonadales bacterium]|nr:TonB-dependent receptor [Gammaproteobacteria bacterium]MBP6480191.1 TonB-dependent receptor [Pseudomonadales bacterium]MBP7908698.1 TonB-dependent receptor [Pseudomonadales bacterium]